MSGRTLREMINETAKRTKTDGRRRKLRFDKAAFLEEFPQASTNDGFELAARDGIVRLEFEKNVPMSAGELRKLCKENPNHPLAVTKRLSVIHLTDEHEIILSADEVRSLKEDKGGIIAPYEDPDITHAHVVPPSPQPDPPKQTKQAEKDKEK